MLRLEVTSLLTALVLLHTQSWAAVVYSPGEPDHVLAVTNVYLPANGRTYDVTFDGRSFGDIWGEDPLNLNSEPTFWTGVESNDDVLAMAARTAVLEQLLSESPVPPRIRDPNEPTSIRLFEVPSFTFFEDSRQKIMTSVAHRPFSDDQWVETETKRISSFDASNTSYAIFTDVTAVPEPTTFMPLIALAVVTLIRRRKSSSRHQR